MKSNQSISALPNRFEHTLLHGVITALVTPFTPGKVGEIDYKVLHDLVEKQASGGVRGVVPCGTTGESPTLSHEEHQEVIEVVTRAAKLKGLTVIAGTGSNSTKEAVRLTSHAMEIGADACLIVCPYYNKPTPKGLLAHFSALNEIGVPLIIYNIPGRSGINIAPATIADIARACPNVVGLKASNGDLDEITEAAASAAESNRPFSVLSGDDSLTLPILSVGGVGVISVLANILPEPMVALLQAWKRCDTTTATAIMHAIHPLARALLKVGSNPAPIKALMNARGLSVGDCRLPLVAPEPEAVEMLVRLMDQVR